MFGGHFEFFHFTSLLIPISLIGLGWPSQIQTDLKNKLERVRSVSAEHTPEESYLPEVSLATHAQRSYMPIKNCPPKRVDTMDFPCFVLPPKCNHRSLAALTTVFPSLEMFLWIEEWCFALLSPAVVAKWTTDGSPRNRRETVLLHTCFSESWLSSLLNLLSSKVSPFNIFLMKNLNHNC